MTLFNDKEMAVGCSSAARGGSGHGSPIAIGESDRRKPARTLAGRSRGSESSPLAISCAFCDSNQGYIAVVTALIMSMILLFIGVSGSTTGLMSRNNKLDFDNKHASYFLAQSCLDRARLRLGENYSGYTGNETLTVSGATCFILPIETSGQNKIIKARASVYGATTNLKLTVDQSLSQVSLEELASM